MGRLAKIEQMAMSGLPRYNNLKVIVRGRPRFLDPQLDGGNLRFAVRQGFNFSAILPDNQSEISQPVYKDAYTIYMATRPTSMTMNTLIRLGSSESIGELHIVQDILDPNGVEVYEPIIQNYDNSIDQDTIPVVSLVGIPCTVFAPTTVPSNLKIMTIESWYRLVPSDVLLMSKTPTVLESFQEYSIRRADLKSTRPGDQSIGETAIVYRYEIELATKTGRLPFVPSVGLTLYLKPQPLFFRDGFGTGDIGIPSDIGPCVLDAFFGNLLDIHNIDTKLGIQTFDSFGQQINQPLTGGQQWQEIPKNYLVLERPIASDSLLFWQRITGNFQYQKKGYFQAQLTSEGKFSFSSNLLVPKWPTDHDYGWVIPLFSRSDVRCVVQFEPQAEQIFDIPSNTLTFIRPHVRIVYDTVTESVVPLISAGDTTVTLGIPFTVDPLTSICTAIGHGFTTGLKVRLNTSSQLPSGLSLYTDYYIIVESSDTFYLADSLSHAVASIHVSVTDTGIGTHKCYESSINFISLGVKIGQFFSISGSMFPIVSVTPDTLIINGSFLSTLTSVPYQILQQDLTPIDRILISFKGSPNSLVEIRDWEYDGSLISSLSYYILGTKEAYGQKRWLAGGFSVKPLFFNLAVLQARYSDGVSRYNAGYIYV